MPRHEELSALYSNCLKSGFVNDLSEINKEKISSLAENAEISLNSANILAKSIGKDAKEWMNVYTLYYDALRTYAEALLIFKKKSTANHQCLFASLIVHYPELELDWNFFEKIRTMRNSINYQGGRVDYRQWKETELQIKLYINALRKELSARLDGS